MEKLDKKQKNVLFVVVVLVIIITSIAFIQLTGFYLVGGNGGSGEIIQYDTIPSAPVLNDIPDNDVDGIIELSWSESIDVWHYNVWRWKSGEWIEIRKVLLETSFIDSDEKDNVLYAYKIEAKNNIGSSWSDIKEVTIAIPDMCFPPDAPTLSLITPSANDDGIINLDWYSVYYADNYDVYRSKDGGSYSFVIETIDSDYCDSVYENGDYDYKIKAKNEFGESDFSNSQSVLVSFPLPDPHPVEPILNIIIPNPSIDGEIHISWSPVSNVLYYEVYQSKDSGAYIAVESFLDETYYDDSVFVDGTYSYKVKAKNDAGTSDFSNVESVVVSISTLDPPNKPILESIVPEASDDGVISLSWSSISNTLHYELYRSYNKSSFELLKTLEENYCDDLVLDDGVYSYKVKAVNDIGSSDFSNVRYVVVYITEPIEPIEPIEPTDNTMLYILIGVLGILVIPIVVILTKKKKKSR